MLSVVIPAYNEESRLPAALEALRKRLSGRDHEIIVVDDGSADRTAMVAARFGSLVVRHPRNLGKGAAVKSGVLASRGSMVLVTDADMAAPISELSKLEKVLERGADIAVGSREAPGAKVVRASFKRKLAGKVFNLLVRMFTGLPYRDTQCGFKLFRGEAARALFFLAECRGYCFDVEVLLLAREMGLKTEEVGIYWMDALGSKVRLFRDGLRMFKELLETRKRAAVNSSPAIPGTSAPEGASSPAP